MLRARAIIYDNEPNGLCIELKAKTKKDRAILRKIVVNRIDTSGMKEFSVISGEDYKTNVDLVELHLLIE